MWTAVHEGKVRTGEVQMRYSRIIKNYYCIRTFKQSIDSGEIARKAKKSYVEKM